VPATAVEPIAMPYKDYLRHLNNLGKGLLAGVEGARSS
jgi:hypothetical protein